MPPRRRDDDLGYPAGHQPVDEDDRAVGQRGEHGVQDGASVGVGVRPVAGDGALVHRPAVGGQAAADAPVVAVATAGRRRVVDAGGHDDVHLTGRHCRHGCHSSRS